FRRRARAGRNHDAAGEGGLAEWRQGVCALLHRQAVRRNRQVREQEAPREAQESGTIPTLLIRMQPVFASTGHQKATAISGLWRNRHEQSRHCALAGTDKPGASAGLRTLADQELRSSRNLPLYLVLVHPDISRSGIAL